ncbi:metallophosphoesterase [Xanthocytophaga agilis]|uniref:Metallophosphoesterase n=1 Tax=Xanthocytophaga agilis TaxID=3048010 RepID=A0AAE3QXK1_9BACT|nr:metallophosphoesterase [Xanthocytophaga agilis]MDJ1499310.1 metallophosphoesterase [Xanthocytophaga agilis]
MNILLFADLHGRILPALKLATRLQKERNVQLDLIVQCGDMGIYPKPEKFDKATVRHAQRDETELGFSRYFTHPSTEVASLLEELSCDVICVRGNHEDHEFLNGLEQKSSESRFPVDCYKRIYVCKTGHIQKFEKEGQQISIAGIGRIGHRGNKSPNGTQRFIQPYEQQTLQSLRKQITHIDILVTHDCSLHFFDKDFGMQEIRDFLDYHKPFYHFFGHTGHSYQAVPDENRFTTSVKIAELEWQHNGTFPEGSMVLLRWKDQYEHEIEVINDTWIKEYTPETWKYM